jgi:hypothetical protein
MRVAHIVTLSTCVRKALRALPIALVAAVAAPMAHADQLDDNLQTVWESLWDERGTPRTLNRWEQPVKYRIYGPGKDSQREYVRKALDAVAEASGIGFEDVSNDPEAAAKAMLDVEVSDGKDMPDSTACFVRPVTVRNGAFVKMLLKARERATWSCAFHEAMHVMGIPGHPSGKTVLSYFPHRRDTLMELDKLMLRAWYSKAMPRNASPFEALQVLAKAVAAQPDLGLEAAAAEQRARAFVQQRLTEMEAFAQGAGEVPTIIRRSGRASEDFITNARSAMAFFVELSYSRGNIDGRAKDEKLAEQWQQRSAEMGFPFAQYMYGLAFLKKTDQADHRIRAYRWLSAAAAAGVGAATERLTALQKELSPDDLEKAKALDR